VVAARTLGGRQYPELSATLQICNLVAMPWAAIGA
jgi:hypothetical protein